MSARASYLTSSEGLAALAASVRRSQRIFAPAPPLTLSQWADRYAVIPKETSPNPGKFQTSAAEYQRGIMDAITDPDIETVVLMLAAQVGKTQSAVLNPIGYFSHWDPSPMLVVCATLGEAEKFSKKRVAPMIRDTPVLRSLFPSPRSRDSGNTLLNKDFLGGGLVFVGANAPTSLRSMPIRVVFFEEVDAYDDSAGTEGDPVDLASKRTAGFWNRKLVLDSTPAIKNHSRIETAYDASDHRRYYVPCPHCGEMQQLEWKRLKWDLEPGAPDSRPRVAAWWYVCVNGCIIEERSKHEMIRRGEWRVTGQSHDGKTAGFQLNALYSPFTDWIKLIREWLESQGSLERLKVFVNTVLAETWEIRGTGANMTELEKRMRFKDILPAAVLFLTAGVDVQDNRLECSIIGWGMDEERWVVDHRIFPGDPSMPDSDPASPWAHLRDHLLEDWEHERGLDMHVACALIDSGGHHTEAVYSFARKHELRRWYAIVGRGGIGRPLISSAHEVGPFRTKLFTVGVDTAKEDIYTSFRITEPGPGYCHFHLDLDGEYFRQVTAEKLVKTKKDFITTMQWVKVSERNEALDCFVYARAAVAALRPNFRKIKRNLDRWVAQHRAQLQARPASPAEEEIGPAPVDAKNDVKEPAPPAAPVRAPQASVAERLRNRFNAFGR